MTETIVGKIYCPEWAKGEAGFSPKITVKENTEDKYILTITTKDGSYDTPNLKMSFDGLELVLDGGNLSDTQTNQILFDGGRM